MDLYETLGIDRNATLADIRKAYRKLVKTAHPDAGGDPEAFRLLTLAHDVLSDPERRKRYDETGDYTVANAVKGAQRNIVALNRANEMLADYVFDPEPVKPRYEVMGLNERLFTRTFGS